MEKDILLRSAGVDQIGGEGIESEEAAGGAQRGLPAHAVSQIASIVRRNDLDNAGRGRGMHDPAGIAPNKECAEGEDGQATPARVPHQLPPQPMPKWVRAAAGPEGTQKGYVAFRLWYRSQRKSIQNCPQTERDDSTGPQIRKRYTRARR